jgi:hypothetical protein
MSASEKGAVTLRSSRRRAAIVWSPTCTGELAASYLLKIRWNLTFNFVVLSLKMS